MQILDAMVSITDNRKKTSKGGKTSFWRTEDIIVCVGVRFHCRVAHTIALCYRART